MVDKSFLKNNMPSQFGDGDCHLEEEAKELCVMCITEAGNLKGRKNTKTLNWQKVKGSLSAKNLILRILWLA